MKVDAISQCTLDDAAAQAVRIERLGFDRMLYAEVAHDPFLPLTLAASSTERLGLGTGIAVAFARSPMAVAVAAADLHRQSKGRFTLGLGSQIKPHVTRRFSMPWSSPAPQMREYVGALRAIWSSWQEGTPLAFIGEHYQHTLMTPMFDHGPSPYGDPQIFLAGVGPLMTAVAGEVADGYLAHGFTTASYMAEVTMTNLQRGMDRTGRDRSAIEVSAPVFSVIARDERHSQALLGVVRHTLAFYGSTPAYRPVLEHHGWGDLGDELTRLSKSGGWAEMAAVIDDEVLAEFAIVSTPEEFPAAFAARYGGLVDRLQLGIPEGLDDDTVGRLVEEVRRLPEAATLEPA